MLPVKLIEAIREPPPDSLVGLMTRADGRVMRTMPFVILINLAWVFFVTLIARESFLRVILPSILSVPVFVWLHLCTYYTGGGPAVRRRFIASIVALC
jgi:hypothetical protein